MRVLCTMRGGVSQVDHVWSAARERERGGERDVSVCERVRERQ